MLRKSRLRFEIIRRKAKLQISTKIRQRNQFRLNYQNKFMVELFDPTESI